MRSAAQLVKEVEATMTIEGYQLKNHEVKVLYDCAYGKISSKDVLKVLIEKYSLKKVL